MNPSSPVIALVAGETSGDQLGAALIEQLRAHYPGARFVGIGGSRMGEAGVDAWWDSGDLAVMGLFEVLAHFPRLLRIRRALKRRLVDDKPDVFIGIDAPDFNLGLEISLRRAGIRTVHYVSPTVWAWREKRVRKIGRAADLVLCLFPFEPAFYTDHGVTAEYVGHPMADQITADTDPAGARDALGLDPSAPTIALLPGSRVGEVRLLAQPMIDAAVRLRERRPGLQFTAAVANEPVGVIFRQAMAEAAFEDIKLVADRPRQVMAAADVVLCASGTAALEAMLVNRPMVVTYRVAASTYFLVKKLKLLKPRLFSLPNILAGRALVPELIQDEARGDRMAGEVLIWLDNPGRAADLAGHFNELHATLRRGASERAAAAVSKVLNRRGP